MSRNDWIFFSTIGAGLALLLLCGTIAYYADSQTAPLWAQSILTGLAIIVAVVVPLFTNARDQEIRHRIAEVTVAAKLRSWLRVAAQDVRENQVFESSGGNDGTDTIEIPDFAISPTEIAAMRPHLAKDVLSLVERRERRQSDIYSERYYDDDTAALMEYYAYIGHLFWSARRIYQDIARDRGLETDTNRPAEIASIKRVQERAAEYASAQR